MSRLNVREWLRFGWIKQRAGWIIGALVVVGACVAIRNISGPEHASAKAPLLPQRQAAPQQPVQQASATQPAGPTQAQQTAIVAMVNGAEISRNELGTECIRHHGKNVLEALINKQLITNFCQQKGITVTSQEVDAEIDRMARKFGLEKEKWMKMLEKERGIKPAQYGSDIIWPTLALRKLADAELQVTKQELDEAYEAQFGPGVKARLIAVKSQQKADALQRQAAANPDSFGKLAKDHSDDVNSASAYGLIQPIRRYMGDPKLEQAAFSLKPGEVSQVVQVGDMFVLLKCEDHIPRSNASRAVTDPVIEEAIRDRKLRQKAGTVFEQLQKQAEIVNVYNNDKLREQMPGVAAVINGQKISVRQLAEECIARHGLEVLEGTINHKLLEQALKRKQLMITDADIDDEIARAAVAMGKVDSAGHPDLKGWIETVTKDQGISEDIYIHDAVWPSVALKKLAGSNVKVFESDIQKGYDANYGAQVRCLAIVCNSQRKAQEVWDLARKNPTAKNFGDLAEQYSIEPNSKALRGQVPPLRKNGGQPKLESEAFSLQPGDLSGVIQVAENFVILYCEGYTQPVKVRMEEVRNQIYDDILEKKQRIAMGEEFERIKDASQVDNFLAGTMHAPKKGENAAIATDPRVLRK